jgi:hypothetical protein
MVKGPAIQERDVIKKPEFKYRELKALNQSMIALFDENPVKFFEYYKLGREKKDKKGTAMIIGDIVDFYILDCRGDDTEFENRFEEKFALFNGNKGTAQVYTLVDHLFDVTKENSNEDGEVLLPFEDRFKEALERSWEDGKYKYKDDKSKERAEEKALEEFNDKGLTYFQTLLDNAGKTVIDVSLLDKSKKVAIKLLTDPFTADLFDEDSQTMEYFPKFPLEWVYTTRSGREIKCKSEFDMLTVDHANKIIYLRDVKTNYDNESWPVTYLKNKYYLQAAFYYKAAEYWAKQEGLEGYTIKPMEFVVGDTSANNRRPIRYQTTGEDLQSGLNGFTLRGNHYRGLDQLIDDILWAEASDIWDCSREVLSTKGILPLNIQYE